MSFDLNSEFIAQFLNMQLKALGLGSMQDALTSILYIGTHFEHNLQPDEIINSSRLLPSLQMSPIYLILKNIKNARSNFTTIPKKTQEYEFPIFKQNITILTRRFRSKRDDQSSNRKSLQTIECLPVFDHEAATSQSQSFTTLSILVSIYTGLPGDRLPTRIFII